MIFKVTSKTQFQALGGLIFTTVIFLIFFLGMTYVSGLIMISIWACVPLYLLFYLLPVVLLHINYLKYAKGIEVTIKEHTIAISGKKYNVNEIVSFDVYSTLQRKRKKGSATTLAHDEYYYYIRINLKNDKPIILNSLLGLDMDDALKEEFPQISLNYHFNSFIGLMITENCSSR